MNYIKKALGAPYCGCVFVGVFVAVFERESVCVYVWVCGDGRGVGV